MSHAAADSGAARDADGPAATAAGAVHAAQRCTAHQGPGAAAWPRSECRRLPCGAHTVHCPAERKYPLARGTGASSFNSRGVSNFTSKGCQ